MAEPSQRGGIVHHAIRRPVGTLAIASVVLVLGLFFVTRLPVDLLPRIEYPQITVTVNYPGAAPEVMEQQITRVLESNLAATENLIRIDSRASEGRTNVNLHFDYGTNLDIALQDASRYLELARTQLPPGIEPPRIYKRDPSQAPVWTAGFSSPTRSQVEVNEWVERRLAPQLLAIGGVSGVEAAGGQVREMEVLVDQDRLASYGLSMQDVIDALADENVDIAAGWVTSASFDVMAKTDGLFTSAEDVANVLINLPGGNGRRIPLSELAEVRDGHREQRLFARLDGTPAVQVSVFKLPGANTVEVVDEVNDAIGQLSRSGFIPDDIVFEVIGDTAFFIRSAVSSVASAAILGGVLAMVFVLFFLGSLRRSFVIGLAIPIAVLATFVMMGLGGLTLNIISLGGLALGVGLLLDNSIVMLENIHRHRQELGKDPERAAHDGAGEVAGAIIAGTLTNLAAVVPFLLITGLAALIFRELMLTISFAIIATLAAALTLTPMLAVLVSRARFKSGLAGSRPIRAFDGGVQFLRRRYRRVLPRLLRWRAAVIAAALAGFAGSLWLGSNLGTEFLPQVDDGQVSVRLSLPPGSPPHETDAAARQIEAVLGADPYVQSMFTLVGGHLGGGIVNERPGTSNIRVQLTEARERPEMPAGVWVANMREALEALDIPGARIWVRPPSISGLNFGPGEGSFSISVVGEDLTISRQAARQISARLQGIRGLEGVEVGREDESPLMRISVDTERAAALGLRTSEIGAAVRAAVDGAVPTRFMADAQEYELRVRLPRSQTGDSAALANLILFRPQGAPVRLGDVATISLGAGPAHIERDNQNRVVRVNGEINTAVSDVSTVMAQVEGRLADMDLPDEIGLVFEGQWQTIQETNRELTTVVLLALFLVFVVMAVQYERISNPLVILATAPLAITGVVLALVLTGTPLSAPVMIGAILLIGIVVNNAILLVEYIEKGRRERGLSPARAVVSAGTARLRPVLMTTATTALGMSPLAFGAGPGGEIMQPLALAVIGGLLVATVLTLLVIPSLYLIVDGASRRLTSLMTGR